MVLLRGVKTPNSFHKLAPERGAEEKPKYVTRYGRKTTTPAATERKVEMSVSMSDTQFEALLSKLSPGRHGSFTTCKAEFDGTKDSEVVEAFLAAVTVFKQIENVSDAEALTGLPLLLKDAAAVWWQGVKKHVSTWKDFEERLRHAFAPKKPAYVIFQEIVHEKQDPRATTESFIAHKRMLFAQLPEPEIPESHQLHMIYGQLKHRIREKIPRNTVKSYDDLLEAARGVEQMWIDKLDSGDKEAKANPTVKPRVKCGFCHFYGHATEKCRKLKRKQREVEATEDQEGKAVTKTTQAPSPSAPKVTCYGCGAPGVVRSSCPTCCANRPRSLPSTNLAFCPVDIQTDVRNRPIVFIEVDGIKGAAYIDTCAKTSIASYQLYQQLVNKGYKFHEESVKITLADGIGKNQRVKKINVSVRLEDRIIPTSFIVLPNSRDNRTLLGIGFMQDARMVLNLPQFTWEFLDADTTYELYEEDFVTFEKPNSNPTSVALETIEKMPSAAVASSSAASIPEGSKEYRLIPLQLSPTKKAKRVFDGYLPAFGEYMMHDAEVNIREAEVTLSPHSKQLFPSANEPADCSGAYQFCSINIDDGQKEMLNKILDDYEDVFIGNNKPSLLGEHCIVTKSDNPISVPPYRLSQTKKDILKGELHEMIEKAIIEPCSSPWASPVVLVPKPNGKVRVCIDYRRLNAITVPDTYPIPRIDDLLHAAKPMPYMTSLDLKSGYWQIRIRKEDEEKTAFITPFGLYKFKRMPFGLRNAPATFQRLVDRFRVTLEHVNMLAYLDDLLLFSSTFESHLSDLKDVFQRMREYNITVNKEKCRFFCSSIKYLGHIITPEGLKPDPDKTKAILERPPPKNLQHLISFLQMCSWYRRFIENFSAIAQPLTKLTKKDVRWVWSTEQEEAYNALKTRLTTAPVLRQADETKPYILKTDASSYALGAVLVQGEKEDEHPVEYASRLLTAAEKNYSTTEREALAVIWALNKFRAYVEGHPVTVVTDHQALKWLMNLKSPAGRLARWALQLQTFNIINITYQPGKLNTVADALSRPPCCEDNTICEICSVIVDMPTRSVKEIREEQMKDDRIQKIIGALEETKGKEDAVYWSNKGYLMNNGMLYRLHPDSEADDAQLVVPSHEWANVLSAYHDDPLAGHYGAEKTYQKIANRYYWTGMRSYVASYVKNCLECQRYKPCNQKPAGLLQTTSMCQRFEVVSFDLFGPLPQTEDGKTWILIVEDVASRWVELFALVTATAETCATTLINEVFLRYGMPRRVISDNGTQFVSAVMQQVMYTLNIKHQYTPLYHPEANPVERKNRDLKTQLAIMVQRGKHNIWSELLPAIRFAMNSTTGSTTSKTPAYLTFGRELRSPRDNEVDFRNIVTSENIIPEITPKLVQLAETLIKAREVQEMKEESRKAYVDKHRREQPHYQPGDLVLVTLHPVSKGTQGTTAKFAPRRDGPYVILNKHGPTSFKVASPNEPTKPIGLYHVSALTPYKGKSLETVPEPVQPLRRRGRPRKEKPINQPSSGPKRGRGRPRK